MDLLFVVDDNVTEEELLKLSKKFCKKSNSHSEATTSSFIDKMRPTVFNTELNPKLNTEEKSMKKCKTALGRKMQKKYLSDIPIVKNGMLRRINGGSTILTSSDSEDDVDHGIVGPSIMGTNPLINSPRVKRRRKYSESLKQELKKSHPNLSNIPNTSGNKLNEVVVDASLNICDILSRNGGSCSYISELPGSLLEVSLDSDTEKTCTFTSKLKRNASNVVCKQNEKKRKPNSPAVVKEMGRNFTDSNRNSRSKLAGSDGSDRNNSSGVQLNTCYSKSEKKCSSNESSLLESWNQIQEGSLFPGRLFNVSVEIAEVSLKEDTPSISSPLVIQQPTLNIPDWMYVALDCEMVGTGPKGKHSALARCSIVDYNGKVIYDHYIKPSDHITDYRTPWSGIRPHHMSMALPCSLAVPEIKKFLDKKIVIGHAVYHDFKALEMQPAQFMVRDTARSARLVEMAGLQGKGNSLKKLSAALLDRHIQVGKRGHCSVEDAKATLDLFKLVRTEWEPELMTNWVKKDPSIAQKLLDIINSCVANGDVNHVEDFLHDKFWPSA
ncbi:unnamed protein product [Lymnaea stagnalis]|uniref:Exonuclease domain-containing protein n=1 Tax=Lymnaea stagnalis TaxID=6523 RepID=A0AAV2HYC2_LYMST